MSYSVHLELALALCERANTPSCSLQKASDLIERLAISRECIERSRELLRFQVPHTCLTLTAGVVARPMISSAERVPDGWCAPKLLV
ncbi:hypothetical protein SAMN05216330_102443 [Bradyrhizobium sp. Ghvi]|nr:hypothetical protein SAMN05216330_102443 [Bradyrhizobium sp. Ghvi]